MIGDRDFLNGFSAIVERRKTVLDAGCGDGVPVDAYLVKQGFAVNGIDASARKIECARKNVPEGFFEVKDMLDLAEGEYCVDGVVSLQALLHIPHERYRGLLAKFASFMPNGGALLLAMRTEEPRQAGELARGAVPVSRDESEDDNTDLIEDAGFTIMLTEIGGPADTRRRIVLARS